MPAGSSQMFPPISYQINIFSNYNDATVQAMHCNSHREKPCLFAKEPITVQNHVFLPISPLQLVGKVYKMCTRIPLGEIYSFPMSK